MNVVLNNILEIELKRKDLGKDLKRKDLDKDKDLDNNKNLGKISYWYHAFIGYHSYFCQLIKSIDFSCQEDLTSSRKILEIGYEVV